MTVFDLSGGEKSSQVEPAADPVAVVRDPQEPVRPPRPALVRRRWEHAAHLEYAEMSSSFGILAEIHAIDAAV